MRPAILHPAIPQFFQSTYSMYKNQQSHLHTPLAWHFLYQKLQLRSVCCVRSTVFYASSIHLRSTHGAFFPPPELFLLRCSSIAHPLLPADDASSHPQG